MIAIMKYNAVHFKFNDLTGAKTIFVIDKLHRFYFPIVCSNKIYA